MDVAYNRHSPSSRRSYPSLNHLSLAPLTPKLPISDPDALPSPPLTQRTSYIEPRSTPTTPSILSPSPSRTRLRAQKSKSTHTLTALTSLAPVSKSKSSVSVASPSSRPPRYPSGREDSEWLLRAGALIASSTRESKGQAWLATRSSSTSLVDAGDDENGDEAGVGEGEGEVADDEFSPVLSTRGSASRFASARSSRRGSRVGSRVEVAMSVGGKLGRGEGTFVDGPDFVDGVEEDEVRSDGEGEVDEVELRRLTREKGFGLGGWVDRVIGWSLFRAEDEERVEGHEELNDRPAERDGLASEENKKRQENERVVQASMDEQIENVPPPGDREGGWQDAAWLLGVASKVIL